MMHAAFTLFAKTTDVYAMAVVAVLLIAAVIFFSLQDQKREEPFTEEPAPKPAEIAPESVKLEESQFSGLQILGLLLILGGLAFGLIACLMDVTVSSGTITVNNLGLLNDRLMYFIASGFAFLSGLLMMLLGGKK
jgi:hypothetical protein